MNADILSAIRNLYLKELAITYNSKSGKWSIKTYALSEKNELINSNFAEIDLTKVKFREIGYGQEFVYALYLPAMRFRTDNSHLLEKELHKSLIINRAQINLSGRREWFRSNITNVENLFSNLSKKGDI